MYCIIDFNIKSSAFSESNEVVSKKSSRDKIICVNPSMKLWCGGSLDFFRDFNFWSIASKGNSKEVFQNLWFYDKWPFWWLGSILYVLSVKILEILYIFQRNQRYSVKLNQLRSPVASSHLFYLMPDMDFLHMIYGEFRMSPLITHLMHYIF